MKQLLDLRPARTRPIRRGPSLRRWWAAVAVATVVTGSSLVTGTAQAASAPSAATAVTATASGTSATLAWSAPSTDGGSTVTAYVVSRDGVDSSGFGAWSGTFSSATRSATFGSLVLGSTYNLSVQSVNAAGKGPVTVVRIVAGRGPVVVPSIPTGVLATASATSALLRWTAPSNDGGSAVTGYWVGRDGVDSTGFGSWSGTLGASATSNSFNLLKPGATYTLTVRAINAVGAGPAATVRVVVSPSGAPIPTGNVSGWRQVFSEDFTSDVALGSWPGSYAAKWDDYTDPAHADTSGMGVWNTRADLSAGAGSADYFLHSVNGVPQSAALVPRTPTMTNGRYSVRFKVDPGLTGWASAWLLWPSSDDWDEGEIDFPEGELTGSMNAFTHTVGNPSVNAYAASTGTAFAGGWHTATTEWTSAGLKFFLDDRVVGSTTRGVPTAPMHWVLQSETAYGARPTSSGHIKIDWAVAYVRS